MISRRFVVLALAFCLAAFVAPKIGLAAEDNVAQAISHTKEAITAGKAGHAPDLVTHSEAALKYAEAAEKETANPHTQEGITHLKEAIDTGKKAQAEVATKHAEQALTHLEQIK